MRSRACPRRPGSGSVRRPNKIPRRSVFQQRSDYHPAVNSCWSFGLFAGSFGEAGALCETTCESELAGSDSASGPHNTNAAKKILKESVGKTCNQLHDASPSSAAHLRGRPGGGMSLPRTPSRASNSASSRRSAVVACPASNFKYSFRARLRYAETVDPASSSNGRLIRPSTGELHISFFQSNLRKSPRGSPTLPEGSPLRLPTSCHSWIAWFSASSVRGGSVRVVVRTALHFRRNPILLDGLVQKAPAFARGRTGSR
jgi:hypothetical protein